MDLIQAIVLGLLQGLTEFLPVSSTAHIRIVPALAGWNDPGPAFTAAIQLGTLLAVLIYFRTELLHAVRGWVSSLTGRGYNTQEARMGWAIFVGTIPIVVLGVLFKDQIENEWRSLNIVAGSLILMGLVLLAAEFLGSRKRGESSMTPKDGLWVGLWQSLALVPGMSRSGSSIAGALFLGMDRPSAARLSFLLSVPSVFAAGIFSIVKHRHELLGSELVPMLVANGVSFLSGYLAIAFLIKMLQRHGTYWFVAYRVVLGLAIYGLMASGTLSPMAGMEGPAVPSSSSR
ncbi:MAG: undecaprenyl-diphosphatase UppP [Armatimonadetes bacterium]|nr:undecaprenyl-diphosphatase UppP [Armatimonadota bacterium]